MNLPNPVRTSLRNALDTSPGGLHLKDAKAILKDHGYVPTKAVLETILANYDDFPVWEQRDNEGGIWYHLV